MRSSTLVPGRYRQFGLGGLIFIRPDNLALAVLDLNNEAADADLHVGRGINLMPAHHGPDLELGQDLAYFFRVDRAGFLDGGFENGTCDKSEGRVVAWIRTVFLAISPDELLIPF